MKGNRLPFLVFLGVLVLSLVAASSASAFSSNPLFTPADGQSVTGSGGLTVITADGFEISCATNQVVSGSVESGLLIGGIVIHYLGCVVLKGGEEANGCSVKSTNATAEGLILTNTLHAILGLLLPSGETGALILPVSGSTITTFAKTETGGKGCTPETAVTGTVAALVSPVGSKQTTDKLTALATKTAIDLTHGLGPATSKLTAFSANSELIQTDSNAFGEATEVT